MGLNSASRPSSNRSAPKPGSSARRYDSSGRYESHSPPRTPPSRSARSERLERPRRLNTQSSFHQTFPHTFLDDAITPMENSRGGSDSGDERDRDRDRDPHDLSFHPNHMARASVVDNLLLSLDKLPNSPLFPEARFFGDADPYNTSPRFSRSRGRAHTYSSSVSDDVDAFPGHHADYYASRARHRRPSTSSIAFQPHHRPYGSSGADGGKHSFEDMDRSQYDDYDARQDSRDGRSSAEYGPGPPIETGKRRSMSFDYGSGPFLSRLAGNSSFFVDDIEAAPTPTVPAGPRREPSFNLSEFAATNPFNFPPPKTPILSRRNSNRSARSTTTRKGGRSENPGTSTVKPREDPAPSLPTADAVAPGPTVSYQKPTNAAPAQQDPAPAKEKTGFFRRVFGSSKTPDTQQNKMADSGARQSPRTNPKETSAENSTHVVVKKASFFRRRKKSVADHVPPPLNLVQSNLKGLDPLPAEHSPASSLRKVMDPFLADGGAVSKEHADDIQDMPYVASPDVYSPTRNQPERSRRSSNADGPKRKPSLNIEITKHDRNDSESIARDFGVRHLDRPKTSPVSSNRDDESQRSPADNKPPSSSPKDRVPGRSETHSGTYLSPTESVYSNRGLPLREGGPESAKESNSDVSQYHTACSTPMAELPDGSGDKAQAVENSTADDGEQRPSAADRELAQRFFDCQEEIIGNEPAATWLGHPDRAMVRKAYMELFNWKNMDILAALRSLCSKMALKGETQQVDRVLDAMSARWCECNPNHGFKAVDVVHTICYSLLLLNTDLHMADIDHKMTRSQFVRNTLPTISRVAADAAPDGFETIRPARSSNRGSMLVRAGTFGDLEAAAGEGEKKTGSRGDTAASEDSETSVGPLVNTPFNGTKKAWESQIEAVLKDFYNSIQRQRLPLYGSDAADSLAPPGHPHQGHTLRRSPSVLSKTGSDILPRGRTMESRLAASRFSSKTRSRARLYPPSVMASSRTSLDDQSSVWTPSGSSTWSKYSLSKTMASMSVESFASDMPRGDYQQSIGFANALSHAIIREDSGHSINEMEDPGLSGPALLEDESLELAGAPWAKEGPLKHKQHLDAVDKRSKDRNWTDCFAVIQRGWLRLFSFNTKSMRQKSKQRQGGGGEVVVGGGNWMDNAEEIWKFMLRQTIASALPPPGYSKSRPHVWALSLPTGAVHLFQVGTAEIVKEFVTTANYWSARLSKEPLIGGVSNMEFGWSDAVINSAITSVVSADGTRSPPTSSGASRPSLQGSIRSSIDHGGVVKAKLPADRVHISEWTPPQQSMAASTLSEADQLRALQNYVQRVEEELRKHNELRPAMVLAYSPRHPNAAKAMANWERKSSYLLREIVKFQTYIDCLQAAQAQKEKIYAAREANSHKQQQQQQQQQQQST